MKGKSRLPIAALAVVGACLLSIPAISQAHKKTYPTAVTATAQNKNQVSGNVTSLNPKCLPLRSVGLYSATGALEASASTDAQGAFRIKANNLPAGTHYVNVAKRVIRKTRHHRHTCGGVKTTVIVS